jgi:predicted nucleotidyltransferase
MRLDIHGFLLFGFYAKGLQKKYSDVDLAIFSKDFTDSPIENIKKSRGQPESP